MKTPRLPKLTSAQTALYVKAALRAVDASWMASCSADADSARAAALCSSNILGVLADRLAGEMPANPQITPEAAEMDADFWYATMRHNKARKEAEAAKATHAAALEICYQ